ncbi:MAG: 2-phospho-L-lactate guanylyltransferase [Chloroflexota bacterium]
MTGRDMLEGRGGRQAGTWAIVPLRGLETAKTRLGPALDAEERLALVIAMASRTLTATRDAEAIAGTVLVTADAAAADLARSFGARTLVQRLPGLNAALREARAEAVRSGATATIIIPIDLPAIDAAGLDALLAKIAAARSGAGAVVGLVPDRHGRGTNVLYTAPPDAIDPAFGDGSLAAHRTAALEAGAQLVEIGGPLVLDVDTGDDLLAAETAASAARHADAATARAGHIDAS